MKTQEASTARVGGAIAVVVVVVASSASVGRLLDDAIATLGIIKIPHNKIEIMKILIRRRVVLDPSTTLILVPFSLLR